MTTPYQRFGVALHFGARPSFCGWHRDDDYLNKHGLLSQWRAYGVGGGYAIEFRTAGLEEILSSEVEKFHYCSMFLAAVVYDDNKERIKEELEEHLQCIAEHSRVIDLNTLLGRNDLPQVDQQFEAFEAIFSCMSCVKHRGFKEENEVRIVMLPMAMNNEYRQAVGEEDYLSRQEKERKFRDKDGMLVPYVEIPLAPKGILPINRIIVGPHKDKEERATALRLMLGGTIDVTVSDIPYIG